MNKKHYTIQEEEKLIAPDNIPKVITKKKQIQISKKQKTKQNFKKKLSDDMTENRGNKDKPEQPEKQKKV